MTASAQHGVGRREVVDGVGVLTIDYPPVNALSVHVRRALDDGFRSFTADPSVRAIVLICAGRTFIAGADITELGRPPVPPSLLDVFEVIEQGTKPVIAAIHGTALGGGFEFAMVCHYRIAVPSAKVGLPEVALGLLPGGGGTQRLPRLVGVEAALELIALGQPVSAERALVLGMIDSLAREDHLREDAIGFARRLVDQAAPLRRVRDRQDKVEPARGHPEIYTAFLANHIDAFRGFKAPFHIVKAIEAAAELPFEAGILRERELFGELLASPESAAQRYWFFAQRLVNKPPALTPEIAARIAMRIGAVPAEEAVNEGAKLLAEGIAARAADVDVTCIRDLGWPAWTGGPMYAADVVGLPAVVAGLREKGLDPAPLLAEMAANGGAFTR